MSSRYTSADCGRLVDHWENVQVIWSRLWSSHTTCDLDWAKPLPMQSNNLLPAYHNPDWILIPLWCRGVSRQANFVFPNRKARNSNIVEWEIHSTRNSTFREWVSCEIPPTQKKFRKVASFSRKQKFEPDDMLASRSRAVEETLFRTSPESSVCNFFLRPELISPTYSSGCGAYNLTQNFIEVERYRSGIALSVNLSVFSQRGPSTCIESIH